MSMIGNVCRASDEEVARLLAHPEEIGAFLYPILEGGAGAQEGEGEAGAGAASTEVDKAWHGIHYVLTGSDWGGAAPLNFLVSGGAEVGDEDVGYGPPRAFTSAEVRAIHERLDQLPPEQFARRIDLEALVEAGIYPDVWDREEEAAENREYLTYYYARLRSYVATLAREGAGMVVCIT